MSDEDHRQLAALLNKCKAAVVLSGYESSLYDELYQGWQKVTRNIANHAAGGNQKARETECLWIKVARSRKNAAPKSNGTIFMFPQTSE